MAVSKRGTKAASGQGPPKPERTRHENPNEPHPDVACGALDRHGRVRWPEAHGRPHAAGGADAQPDGSSASHDAMNGVACRRGDRVRRRRVGKIASRSVAAWARRARDFAHADARSNAPLPTLQLRAEAIERRINN